MKKILLFFVMAVFSLGIITAQVSRIEYVSGKEMKVEKTFSNKSMTANPDLKKDKPEFIRLDDKYIKSSKSAPQGMLRKKGNTQNFDLQGANFKRTLSVKPSLRNDVATVTLKVIGDPWGDGTGFHLLLDSDHLLYDNFMNYVYEYWEDVYADCDYFIPEDATPDPMTTNFILNGEGTIEIPEGIYDFAVVNPDFHANYIWQTTWADLNDRAILDDFLFKAGFEYVFQIEFFDMVEFYAEHDAKLIEIILPRPSTELTDQEEVKVVLLNNGQNDIDGEVGFSFSINGGEYTTIEPFTVLLEPGDVITYTFITKADFSEGGLYKVVAQVIYDLDLNTPNNKITGYTKKSAPIPLPFYEDFESPEKLMAYWTIINAKPAPFNEDYWLTWQYDDWNLDPDDNFGSLQMNCQPIGIRMDDYLISDPMIIPEAGIYNISFWVYAFGFEKLKVLYGTTSDYTEMDVLQDFQFSYLDTDFEWSIFIKNFEITNPGNYYFAFHYYSFEDEGGGGINFDKVKIASGEFVGVPDIMFNKGLVPVSSCDMGDENLIGATVRNKGTQAIEKFTLTYQVNDNAIVSQDFIKTIGIKESVDVYFDNTVDFSEFGNYQIKFTADTPDEENISNNELELTVRHYSPITTLPFISDFSFEEDIADWTPEVNGGWDINDYFGCYIVMNEGVPLLSRCIHLEPDIYRFTYTFNAGFYFWGFTFLDDFYVTYGKSGTDPYEWEPVKWYNDYMTGAIVTLEEDFIIFEITEAGDYVFAFFPIIYGDLAIFNTLLEVAPVHDLKIKNIESYGLSRLTPVYQVEGEKTIIAVLQNIGKTANESGNIKLFANDDEITSKDFTFTEVAEILNVDLKPVFESFSTGPLKLKFEAEIGGGISKEVEMLKIVSDTTYAQDYIDNYFEGGIGENGGPAKLGLIFELMKSDILTSITVGLIEMQYTGSLGLAVFDVNDDLELGKKYFEVKYPRTNGNDIKGITFSVPETELKPGKYYFELQQLTGDNIGVAIDTYEGGYFYDNSEETGILEKVEMWFGNIHLRPNFGLYGSGISSEKISNSQLIIYPNPVRGELKVDNGELKMEKITICNAAGQVVQTISNVNNTSYKINTERFSSGLYFISVQTKSGIVNSKFIVK